MLAHIDGSPYHFAEITDDLKQAWQKIHADVSAASYPTTFDSFTQRGFELDHLSIVDWIEESIPGGMASRLGRLLDIAYNIEYGAESDEQSSLNLLYLLGYVGQGQFRVFGKSDEKYHVRGGNDQITARLAKAIAGQVTTGSSSSRSGAPPGGRYDLTFRQGSRSVTVTADKVVLALPFSILRHSVDLTEPASPTASWSPSRSWGWARTRSSTSSSRRGTGTGSTRTARPTRTGATRAPGRCHARSLGRRGSSSTTPGGDIGASFGPGTPTTRAQQFLTQIEPVLPGLSAHWNGKATVDFWPGYEWTRGSYSYWKVGQYTAFAGIEGTQEDNAHFCGEHTSIDFQGYLNGAVETGEAERRPR